MQGTALFIVLHQVCGVVHRYCVKTIIWMSDDQRKKETGSCFDGLHLSSETSQGYDGSYYNFLRRWDLFLNGKTKD